MNAAQGMANVGCLDHLVRRGITDDDGVLGGAVSITQVQLSAQFPASFVSGFLPRKSPFTSKRMAQRFK